MRASKELCCLETLRTIHMKVRQISDFESATAADARALGMWRNDALGCLDFSF